MTKTTSGSARLSALLLQGAAVLVSILTAFAIDAWWDSASDRRAEHELLEALRAELVQNRDLLEQRVVFTTAVEDIALTLVEMSSGTGSEPSADSVQHLLADVTWAWNAPWETATVDALISSGDLSLIQDHELRTQVAALSRRLEQASSFEAMDRDVQADQLIPYLVEHTDLVTLARAMVHEPGSGAEYAPSPRLPPVRASDYRPLLRDEEFRNLLMLRYWSLSDLLGVYRRVDRVLNDLLATVGAELAG